MSLSFVEKAARVKARRAVEHVLERTRRMVALLVAIGLGIVLGFTLANNRYPWVIAGLFAFGLSMIIETSADDPEA